VFIALYVVRLSYNSKNLQSQAANKRCQRRGWTLDSWHSSLWVVFDVGLSARSIWHSRYTSLVSLAYIATSVQSNLSRMFTGPIRSKNGSMRHGEMEQRPHQLNPVPESLCLWPSVVASPVFIPDWSHARLYSVAKSRWLYYFLESRSIV